MRRNCPHCGTDQLIPEEKLQKLSSPWAFSRCHSCGETSVIQNAIASAKPAAAPPARASNSSGARTSAGIGQRIGKLGALLALSAMASLLVLPKSDSEALAPAPALVSQQDTISTQSAATVTRIPAAETPSTQVAPIAKKELKIQVVVNNAILRSGPGQSYRKVGSAPSHLELKVKDWRQDWFQVEIPEVTNGPNVVTASMAWIRNDLVRMTGENGAGQ